MEENTPQPTPTPPPTQSEYNLPHKPHHFLTKKIAVLIIIFLLLSLMSLVGSLYVVKVKNLSKVPLETRDHTVRGSNPAPLSKPTLGWSTYTDDQLFVKFQYPTTMKVTHGSSNTVNIGTDDYPSTIAGRELKDTSEDYIEKNRTNDVSSFSRTEIDHPSYSIEKGLYVYLRSNNRIINRLIIQLYGDGRKFVFITDDKKVQQTLLDLVSSFEFIEAPKVNYNFPAPKDFSNKLRQSYSDAIKWDKSTKHWRNFTWYDNDYNRYYVSLNSENATGSAYYKDGGSCGDCNLEEVLDSYGWEHGKLLGDGPIGGIRQYVLRSASKKSLQLLEVETFFTGLPSEAGSKCPCDFSYSFYLSEPFTPTF